MARKLLTATTEDRRNGAAKPGRSLVSDLPKNPPAETARVERLVERVLEEHRETIEKLADE